MMRRFNNGVKIKLRLLNNFFFGMLDLIYTKDEMIISRQHHEWRVWQEKFKDYKASVSFPNLDAFAEFIATEYNLIKVDTQIINALLISSDSDFWEIELPKTKEEQLSFKKFKVEI
jgi:hypothetical protein